MILIWPLVARWHFNSSVALVVNALAHMKESSPTTIEYYLTTTFMKLTAKVVREDYLKFLTIVARLTEKLSKRLDAFQVCIFTLGPVVIDANNWRTQIAHSRKEFF